jgi:transposase
MKPDFNVEKNDPWFRQCVGIDIARDKFDACLYMYDIASDMGCCTRSVVFSNDRKGFNQLVRWSRKEALKEFPVTYLMEPTGVYHEGLAYHLHKINQTVYIVMPNKARDFCNYEGIKTKTDVMDARCLALLGCANRKLRAWTPPSPVFKYLRQMTRFHEEASKVRTVLLNHLEALEHSEAPEKSVLKSYRKLLADVDRQMADNQERIRVKIASDKDLQAKVDNLCTIKGLGFMTIVTILAETDGFNLITNCRQLVSFAGLDASAHQSGNQDPTRHISKHGNKHLRRALYFPAMVAARHNTQIKDLYTRICERQPKSKKVGLTAAMRKLLLLVFALWKSGEKYDPDRKGVENTSRPGNKGNEDTYGCVAPYVDSTQKNTICETVESGHVSF